MTGIFIDEFNRHMITIFMIILFSIKLWTRRAIRDMETRYFWLTDISCLILILEDTLEVIASLDPGLRFWITNDENIIEKASRRVRESVTEKGYSVSIGYVMTEGYKDIDEAMKASDKLMYEDKSKYYRESGRDRRAR